jgi:hypothetical protein
LREEAEDMWQKRARYAHAVVLDGEHEVLPVREHVHSDATAFRCVFHGVVQEVVDGLRETDRIAVNAQCPVRNLQGECLAALGGCQCGRLERVSQNVDEVNARPVYAERALAGSRDVHQIVGKSGDLGGLPVDHVDRTKHFRPIG